MDALRFIQENIVLIVASIGFIGLAFVFYTGRHDDTRRCVDLITAPNGKYSRTAIGQCFGILLAIFSPIYTTLQGKLEIGVFAASLVYLGGVEMYSIWMRQKQSSVDANLPEGTMTKTFTDTQITKTDVSAARKLKEPI
jgi:hypothetical protein